MTRLGITQKKKRGSLEKKLPVFEEQGKKKERLPQPCKKKALDRRGEIEAKKGSDA